MELVRKVSFSSARAVKLPIRVEKVLLYALVALITIS
jgi:hypothetical protein